MSGVSNGDLANESTFDSAYMYANGDTGTVGKVSLQNTDPISGANVVNAQRLLNELADTDGLTGEGDPNAKVYSSNNYVADGDDRKVAIEKLDQQLGSTQTQLDNLDTLNSQDVTIDPIGSTPNPNGMTLSGQNLNLEPANATNGGVLTAGTQSIGGEKTFVDNTKFSTLETTGIATIGGQLNVNGDLVVNGTMTTINSATVDTVDPNITVNKTGNDASAEGSGFTVDRTGTKGSLKYENALASKFKIGDLAAEAEVVTVSHAQTLTNKTLTSPVINSPTGITKTDVGLSAVTNDAQLKRSANDFNSFTEKTSLVDDDVFIIEDSAASGAKKFVKKVNLGAGGSGGGGAVNLITNGDAESAVSSIFTVYNDGSSARPTDGTGGTNANLTTSVTSTNPLTGTKSFLLTKAAFDAKGSGWSVADFAVPISMRAKVLQIDIDYIVNSGTFAAGSSTTDSDVIWYLYDVTNSTLIEPSSIKMLSSSTTLSDKFRASFQTSATGSSYRLIAHVATTSALAYELKVEVSVSPTTYVYGSPVTDWQSYIPTLTGFGTPAATSFWWRRNGQNIEIRGVFTSGTSTATEARVSLPSGYTSGGSSLIPSSLHEVGTGARQNANGFTLPIFVEQSVGYVVFGIASGTASGYVKQNGNSITNSGENVTIFASIPCAGLSSSVQMSDSYDGRVITANAQIAAAATTTNSGIVQFNTVTNDKVGAITTGASWKYTIMSAGDYKFGINMDVNIACNYQLFVNGSYAGYILSAPLSLYGYGERVVPNMKAGDYVHIVSETGGTVQAPSYFTAMKIQGPQAIAASESINAVYTTAAGQSIPNATDTIIDFGTAEIDNQGRVTTGGAWKFTANTSGVYEVSAYIQFLNGGAWNTAEDGLVSIFKNGSNFTRIGNTASTATHGTYVPIPCASRQIRLLSGDYIDLRAYQTSGSALTLAAASTLNWVSIKKVGN